MEKDVRLEQRPIEAYSQGWREACFFLVTRWKKSAYPSGRDRIKGKPLTSLAGGAIGGKEIVRQPGDEMEILTSFREAPII